jgi:hypothetical protein
MEWKERNEKEKDSCGKRNKRMSILTQNKKEFLLKKAN